MADFRDYERDSIQVDYEPKPPVLYRHDGVPLHRPIGFQPPATAPREKPEPTK